MRRARLLLAAALVSCGEPKPPPKPAAPVQVEWKGPTAGVELALRADRDLVRPGEELSISLSIRNGSNAPLRWPDPKLVSSVRMRCSNLSAHFDLHPAADPAPGEALEPGREIRYRAGIPSSRLRLYLRPPEAGGSVSARFLLQGPLPPQVDLGEIAADPAAKDRARQAHAAWLQILSTGNVRIAVQCEFEKRDTPVSVREARVEFTEGVGSEEMEAVLARHGMHVRQSGRPVLVWATLDDPWEAVLAALRAEPAVASAQ